MKRFISIILLVNVFLLTIVKIGYCSDWNQLGADIDGEAFDDRSGWFVSLSSDGSIIAIGAPYNDGNGTYSGHVRVYKNVSGTWTQIGQDIDGEAANDLSGRSVCLSADGSIVAIGANQNNGNGTYSGHVRIYKWNGSSWNQQGADIDGEAASDYSGWLVSLSADGSVVAIGAHFNDGINGEDSGHVRVYKNVSNTWTQVGSDIDGEAAYDSSGYSVSLNSDGAIVAIGAYANDGVNGSNSGHVRVYKNVSGTWTQVGSDIDGEAERDYSGQSVSISADGSIVAVGADVEVGSYSGHVKVYKWNGSSWNQLGNNIVGEAANDFSGRSVSLSADGSIVAIGALGNDGVNGSNSGHVRIYKWNGSSWNQLGADIDGEAADDNSGHSVSLSANGLILAIGAPYNDGINGSNSGHVRVFEIEINKFPWPMFLPAITINTQH
ncbi:MAG: FG-GAP repeat protein [Proteobacteria bacterium]|nr:FG-GAP repeat protein [Pseudomonadota bacterium]